VTARRAPQYNYDVLDTRLSNNEHAINNLTVQLTTFVKDTGATLERLSDKIGLQGTSWAAARSTNWYGFIAAATAILVVLGGYLGSLKAPIDEKLTKLEASIIRLDATAAHRDDFKDYRTQTDGWLASLRDRQAALVPQTQIDDIDQRMDKRFDALSTRLNDLQKEIEALLAAEALVAANIRNASK
jgi:hypothetical protein